MLGTVLVAIKSIEEAGIVGSWSIVLSMHVLFNSCSIAFFNLDQLKNIQNLFFLRVMIGAAFTFYANGLVEISDKSHIVILP